MDTRRVGGAPTLGCFSKLAGFGWSIDELVSREVRSNGFGDGDRMCMLILDRDLSGWRPRRFSVGSGSFGRSPGTGSIGFRRVIRRTPRGPSWSTQSVSVGFWSLGGARELGWMNGLIFWFCSWFCFFVYSNWNVFPLLTCKTRGFGYFTDIFTILSQTFWLMLVEEALIG